MNKRLFLGTALAAGAAPVLGARITRPGTGPALLTITGDVKANRPAFDPARDIMMHKHKVAFARGYAFDFAALTALPAVTISPTLEYDARIHSLRGPLLVDVLAAAGAARKEDTQLVLRAVDGYAANLTLAQARAQRFVVATHMDGQAMALGGLGPLWALLDADRLPALAAKPLAQRFAGCPWALYHIEVNNQA